MDRLDQIGDVFENTPADAFVSDLPEPALDQIQPGTGRGNEMQMEPWMPFEPGFDSRMLVGPVIVDDEVKIVTGGSVGINLVEEPDKLLMPAVRLLLAGYDVAKLPMPTLNTKPFGGTNGNFVSARFGEELLLMDTGASQIHTVHETVDLAQMANVARALLGAIIASGQYQLISSPQPMTAPEGGKMK